MLPPPPLLFLRREAHHSVVGVEDDSVSSLEDLGSKAGVDDGG